MAASCSSPSSQQQQTVEKESKILLSPYERNKQTPRGYVRSDGMVFNFTENMTLLCSDKLNLVHNADFSKVVFLFPFKIFRDGVRPDLEESMREVMASSLKTSYLGFEEMNDFVRFFYPFGPMQARKENLYTTLERWMTFCQSNLLTSTPDVQKSLGFWGLYDQRYAKKNMKNKTLDYMFENSHFEEDEDGLRREVIHPNRSTHKNCSLLFDYTYLIQ